MKLSHVLWTAASGGARLIFLAAWPGAEVEWSYWLHSKSKLQWFCADCLTLHAVTVILERPDLLRCVMRNTYLKRLHRPGIHLSQPERERGHAHSSALSTHMLVSGLRGVNIMGKIWFRHFKQCQMMKWRAYTREPGASGVCAFDAGSSTQVPLRYLYRGGLEQTGAYSSLTALEREREREREKTQSP